MSDLGIDLGTANVLVYEKGQGIIINEPSVVAIRDTGEVVAIGSEAKSMVGRSPGNIFVVRPIKDGVISDYDITAKMLKYFISKAQKKTFRGLSKPRVVVCAPSGVTGVEQKAIYEATMQAGAKEAHIIEEPLAAAIGSGLPVSEPIGSMVADIGGGTTEVAVISLGGIVSSRSIRVGGDALDEAITTFIKRKYNLMIGEVTAEQLKIDIGCALPPAEEKTALIRGRNLVTGLPETFEVTSSDMLEALEENLQHIVAAIKVTLEKCPPELAGDIIDRGIVLTGGGALLDGIDRLISEETHTPVVIAENALDCVGLGTGKSLDNIALFQTFGKTKKQR